MPSDHSLGARAAFFLAAVGPRLTVYEVSIDGTELAQRSSIELPANVQYAWPHLGGSRLYAVSSNGGPGLAGDRHFATALDLDPDTCRLRAIGSSVPLRSRPLHICVDLQGAFALIAHNNPSGVTVLRIDRNGDLGGEVAPSASLDVGIFAHQIRVMPSGRAAILVTRGNDATAMKPEDPGALKVFSFEDGVLKNRASIAPHGGYGFGPRHLDFHPERPLVYVSLERQNKLQVYSLSVDTLDPEALFTKDTLAHPSHINRPQIAGAVHVHPNGRYVYVANRCDALARFGWHDVASGGENNIAVFEIDRPTGEPTAIAWADSCGFHPRTFSIHPRGHILIAANIAPRHVRDGTNVREKPATLALFRIEPNGTLSLTKAHDVATAGQTLFWSGFLPIAGT